MSTTVSDLALRGQKRLAVIAIARTGLTIALVVAIYFLLPLDHSSSVGVAADLAIGILVLAGIIAWQVRSIVGSDHPTSRAVEALALERPALRAAVRHDVLPHGPSQSHNVRWTGHPHRCPLLLHHGLHHGRFRGHHRQDRSRPLGGHDPDVAGSGVLGAGGAPRSERDQVQQTAPSCLIKDGTPRRGRFAHLTLS